MTVVERRDFHAEAEVRLGRPLTAGERHIDLEANDRVMEAAKQALYEAIEKEKRRSIRKWLAGERHDLRLTSEMQEIIVRLRLAGMDAAYDELARMLPEPQRAMGFSGFILRYAENIGWYIQDELGNPYPGYAFGKGEAAKEAAKAALQRLRDAGGEIPVASRARYTVMQDIQPGQPDAWIVWDHDQARTVARYKATEEQLARQAADGLNNIGVRAVEGQVEDVGKRGLTKEIEQRFPGWVWDEQNQMFVPDGGEIRQAYVRLYGPPRPSDSFDPQLNARIERLKAEGFPQDKIDFALRVHDRGIDGVKPPGVDWELKFRQRVVEESKAVWTPKWDPDLSGGRWVVVDQNGNVAQLAQEFPGAPHASGLSGPRQWNEEWRAKAWADKVNAGDATPLQQPAPAQVRAALEMPGSPKLHVPGYKTHPFIPHESEIAAEKARLIEQGILKLPPAPNPAQMLLFDPQMQPLIDAFKMQLKGITQRIDREGNAVLEINQDAGVQALAKAIDEKVPGALDAAGRMASGPFNKGVGDVYRMKGGLFGKWQYSAVMDKATCEVCKYFDGTIYYSWRAIAETPAAPLPDGGPNPGCFGDQRCRCRPVPYFGEGKVGDVIEPPPPVTGLGGVSIDDTHTTLGSITEADDLERNPRSGSTRSYIGYTTENGHRVKMLIKPESGLYDGRIHEAIREHGDIEHERAAYQLAQFFPGHKGIALQLPEARIAENVHIVDSFYMIDDHEPAIVQRWLNGSTEAYLSDATDDEVRGLGLFDAIIGQHDRHGDNYLRKNGKTYAIDNGLAFPEYNDGPEPWNTDSFNEFLNRFGSDLDDDSIAFLDDFERNKTLIDVNTPWLTSDERAAMWERVDRMRQSHTYVDATGASLGWR